MRELHQLVSRNSAFTVQVTNCVDCGEPILETVSKQFDLEKIRANAFLACPYCHHRQYEELHEWQERQRLLSISPPQPQATDPVIGLN